MPQSEFWPFAKNKISEDVDFGGEASLLQKQLGDMEGEVKEIQMELAAIKRDRLDLHQKKHATDILTSSQEVVKEGYTEIRMPEELGRYTETLLRDVVAIYDTPPVGCGEVLKKKISKLREELIRAKNAADEERFQREKYEAKLKDLELKLNNICCAEMVAEKKEYRKFSEEEVNAMKTQIRDMKEEMEEVRITLVEKTEQLQEYRVKYLQAQQQVEELRRQLDVIEYDNKQVSDQIQIEIQKMKMQFQEKLQELAPLPDLLKGAQIQLQEAKQMQRLAEDSSQQLSNELHRVKEKLVIAVNNMNQENADRVKLNEENKILKVTLDEKQKEIDELSKSMDDYKCKVLRLEEKLSQQDIRFKEKSLECMSLLKDLDELRAESSRSISRGKDRADSMRRYLQTQISEMERQLIQSRAQCRACQKERDEIRQRMQIQINNLQENFELVEIRLRALHNQVSSLKTSYTVILANEEDTADFNKIATSSSN